MSDTTIKIIFTAFGLLFSALAWLVTSKLNFYDTKHNEQNTRHLELSAKMDRRAEAFNNVIVTLEKDLRGIILSDDEIMAVVNGKYISRREYEAANLSRQEWRTLLVDRLNKMDALIERLRVFKDQDYSEDRELGAIKFSGIEKELAILGVQVQTLLDDYKDELHQKKIHPNLS